LFERRRCKKSLAYAFGLVFIRGGMVTLHSTRIPTSAILLFAAAAHSAAAAVPEKVRFNQHVRPILGGAVDSREARIRAVDANELFEEGDAVVAQRIYPLEDPLPELLH